MSRKDPVSRDAFYTAADEIAKETGETPKLQQLRDRVGCFCTKVHKGPQQFRLVFE